jgi:hypothetical protein
MKFKKLTVLFLFTLFFFSAVPFSAHSQCAMCRAGAESNMKSNKNKVGAGLNTGILYLMSIPYIIGGVAGITWFVKRKQIKAFLNSNKD